MHHPRTSPALVLLLAATASAQSIERVSVSSVGIPADLASAGGLVSADGRFVAFSSQARNLAHNDPDGALGPDHDVYLRDRLNATTAQASSALPTATLEGLSADGAFVLFHSGGTTTWGHPISLSVVWERATGVLQPVSTGDLESSAAQISADGRYVAFVGKLLPVGVTVALTQALLLDRATGTTMLMSRTPAGAPGAGLNTSGLSISADGARVAFASDAADLVPGDTNGATDVFVFERATQTVRRLSVDAQGVQGNFGSLWPSISADGRFVAFMSVATNLVPGDTNAKQDFFRTELATGAIERLSVTSAGEQVFGQCGNVRLSGDGRLAFFSSDAPTLVPNDGNESYDVFLRDTEQHTTTRLAVGPGGAEPNGGSNVFSVSPDGRFIGLTSTATNLVPGDVNGFSDVFVVDRGPQCHASTYCAPATGGTAAIGMQGSTSLSANDLVLTCSGLPADTFGRFVLGTQPIDPGVPFGNGVRCIGGTIVRLGLVQAVGTVATLAIDSASSDFAAVRAGETRYFQLVYRDPAPGGSGFGTSDGLLVMFCP